MAEDIKIDPTKALATMARINAAMPKEMKRAFNKELTKSVKDLVKDQRARVKSLKTTGARGSGSTVRYNAAWAKKAGKTSSPLTQRDHDNLRKSSGLRAHTAAALRVVNRGRGSGYELSVRAEGSRMPADQTNLPFLMNKGTWRHPVHKNRKVWRSQSVDPAWFDKPAQQHEGAIAQSVDKAIDNAIKALPS